MSCMLDTHWDTEGQWWAAANTCEHVPAAHRIARLSAVSEPPAAAAGEEGAMCRLATACGPVSSC